MNAIIDGRWVWICSNCRFHNGNDDHFCQRCRTAITCSQSGGHHHRTGDTHCDKGSCIVRSHAPGEEQYHDIKSCRMCGIPVELTIEQINILLEACETHKIMLGEYESGKGYQAWIDSPQNKMEEILAKLKKYSR